MSSDLANIWAIAPNHLWLAYHQPSMSRSVPIRTSPRRQNGGIAVLPLYGPISDFVGDTSTREFTRAFRSTVNDPSVDQIVIEVDSPGGSVYGVDELASEIYSARAIKPIHAIANSLMASAAYWIGSAASDLSCTLGGEVGSIGMCAVHMEASKLYEAAGIKTTLISAGKHKTEGNQYEPLSPEGHAAIQDRVNQYYGMFVSAVARNRRTSQTAVRDGYGQGRALGAAGALKAGLIDRVETLDQMLTRLGPGNRTR